MQHVRSRVVKTHASPVRPRSGHRRRAAILVLAAFVMVGMLAFVAFSLDVGYITVTRAKLQNAADAAALGGAMAVDEGSAGARAEAVRVGRANLAANNPVVIDPDQDVEFGTWDRDTRTFTPGSFRDADAVRVTCRLTPDRENALKLFFAPVLGIRDASITVSAVAVFERSLCGPLVGIDEVKLTGTPTTDSYDSDEGPYAPGRAGNRGNICSDGPIDVIGNAAVNGNANPGKGYRTTIVGSAVVTGNTTPRSEPLELPPVDGSGAEYNNDNDQITSTGNPHLPGPVDAEGNFALTANQNLHLRPGTYHFRDFMLSGQAKLHIKGPTTIYVTGNLETAGGTILNSTRLPSNLKVLMTGEHGSEATIVGNSDFRGILYAPSVDVTTTGTGSLYGAVVGKRLNVTGTGDVHYDERLDLGDEILLPPKSFLVQ